MTTATVNSLAIELTPALPPPNLTNPSHEVSGLSHHPDIATLNLAGFLVVGGPFKQLSFVGWTRGTSLEDLVRSLKEQGFQLCTHPACYVVGVALGLKTLPKYSWPDPIVGASMDPSAILLDQQGQRCFIAIQKTSEGPMLILIPVEKVWEGDCHLLVEEIPDGQAIML